MRSLRTLLPLAAIALATLAAPASGATADKGPAGTRFYTPPSGALKGTAHGGVVWSRKQTGADALRGARSNRLLLYRSIGVEGKAVAVSGSLALPRGRAPKGGWPVISYAHGTSGIADRCAPTRNPGRGAVAGYHDYVYPLLRRWLKAGYAVVRTDYEGLGTPGEHPYLVGRSEGRSVLDIVRAARRLDPALGRRVVLAGHSQGGHAALYATSLASRWTPELDVVGTVAFAPASHLADQASLLTELTTPGGGLSGLAALVLRAVDVADDKADVAGVLSPEATALYPQTLAECSPDLAATDSFGGLAPAKLVRTDVDPNPLFESIERLMDPENLTLRTPVLIEQGESDATVFPALTALLVGELKAKGAKVTYETYKDVGHGEVVDKAAKHATSYVAKRLR